MEWIEDQTVIINTIKKYKWIILVLMIGILLMVIPDGGQNKALKEETPDVYMQKEQQLGEELEQILSQLDGAGKVRILLTESKGQETMYQMDQSKSQSTDSESGRTETVILSDSDRTEYGLIRRVDPPQYLGAIVLCQGADHASVRLAIVDAVGKITGLRSDQISVCKMK